jgi:choice-of-anchor A domain-containing protein
MMKNRLPLLVVILLACCAIVHADPVPFGAASAFNLVALGHGSTVGNIGTTADVEGRMAAANLITQATTIGSVLGSDPYGALAGGYAVVAGAGISSGGYFNINGGGNVYAPSNDAGYNWNENPRGTLVTAGPSPLNFAGLATTLDALSLQLGGLASNGVVGAPTPPSGNPSWLVLSGTSNTLNVFTLTAAEFADANHPLDIQVPAGSTVIVNVLGASDTLGTGIYVNGVQESDTNDDGNRILFNFAQASTVTIDGQFDGALLAPFAMLTGGSQMGGTFIAAEIGETGEVHYDAFEGALPTTTETPEPGTLVLLGTGFLVVAVLRSRLRV